MRAEYIVTLIQIALLWESRVLRKSLQDGVLGLEHLFKVAGQTQDEGRTAVNLPGERHGRR